MMKRLVVLVIGLALPGVAAGVEIPPPAGISDSLVHPDFDEECYSSALYHPTKLGFNFSQNIGDFDGDGSDDIFVEWGVGVTCYKSSGEVDHTYCHTAPCAHRYHVGVYSLRKGKYLFTGVRSRHLGQGNVITGDFDGDNKIDFVIGSKIYLGVNSLAKKKVYP